MSKNSNVKSDSGSQGGGRSGGPKMSEGDWLCTDAECANWNFAWRTSCNRCGAEKASGTSDSGGSSGGSSSYSKKKKLGQEIGKAMAEKSRGLFSADDWQCNKCGNVNWARRHQCNVCNAPRYGEVGVEERTGYGGGYNDRGVVEYKERIDSDDEWDEFGRKKKKQQRRKENSESDDGPSQSKRRRDERRSSSEREDEEEQERPKKEEVKEVVSKKTKEESSNEEDEEDDDDDDGDLSKYDLSGWGDEDDK